MAGTTYGTMGDPHPGSDGDDLGERGRALLAVHRPKTEREWAKWHINRRKARRLLDRQDDGPELAAALGLDPDAEQELIKWMS